MHGVAAWVRWVAARTPKPREPGESGWCLSAAPRWHCGPRAAQGPRPEALRPNRPKPLALQPVREREGASSRGWPALPLLGRRLPPCFLCFSALAANQPLPERLCPAAPAAPAAPAGPAAPEAPAAPDAACHSISRREASSSASRASASRATSISLSRATISAISAAWALSLSCPAAAAAATSACCPPAVAASRASSAEMRASSASAAPRRALSCFSACSAT